MQPNQPQIVEWYFPNINLPDSFSNEPASHGFVRFSIQAKQGLPLGTSIDNKASIFFDYNAPVVTDAYTIVVALESSTNAPQPDVQCLVYPNPFIEVISFRLLGADAYPNVELSLWDVMGREVLRQPMLNATNTSLDRSQLPHTGLYFYRIISNEKLLATGTFIAK